MLKVMMSIKSILGMFNFCMTIEELLCFPWFSCVLCIINQIFEEEHYFCVACIYVKSVGFTNVFLLQYRAPELSEF